VKYSSKSNIKRQYYLPREVAEMLGREAELIPNAHALVMFPKGASARKVLRSVEVIKHDLENQIAAEEEEKKGKKAEGYVIENIAERLARLEKAMKKWESGHK